MLSPANGYSFDSALKNNRNRENIISAPCLSFKAKNQAKEAGKKQWPIISQTIRRRTFHCIDGIGRAPPAARVPYLCHRLERWPFIEQKLHVMSLFFSYNERCFEVLIRKKSLYNEFKTE